MEPGTVFELAYAAIRLAELLEEFCDDHGTSWITEEFGNYGLDDALTEYLHVRDKGD